MVKVKIVINFREKEGLGSEESWDICAVDVFFFLHPAVVPWVYTLWLFIKLDIDV